MPTYKSLILFELSHLKNQTTVSMTHLHYPYSNVAQRKCIKKSSQNTHLTKQSNIAPDVKKRVILLKKEAKLPITNVYQIVILL
jgi:hypothetical protein